MATAARGLERHYEEDIYLLVDAWDPHEPWTHLRITSTETFQTGTAPQRSICRSRERAMPVELYDLDVEPRQQRNIAADNPGIVKELHAGFWPRSEIGV